MQDTALAYRTNSKENSSFSQKCMTSGMFTVVLRVALQDSQKSLKYLKPGSH